jgi:hypothetical protein
MPRWNGEGSAIYYATSRGFASTPVRFTANGPDFGSETRVFDVDIVGGQSNTHRYDMTDDANRFVVQLDPDRDDSAPPLELMVGWRQILERQ